MQPTSGGRITLRLQQISDDSAYYRAELLGAGQEWRGLVSVALTDGAVKFQDFVADPPQWLTDIARTALRSAWRAREQVPWPRRITRWREA